MSTRPHTTPDPSAETLAERLARARDLAGPRQPGDTFGQAGWQHQPYLIEPPTPPSVWLTMIPFLVLIIVAVALTIALLVLAGHPSQSAGWTWDDLLAVIGAQS